MLVTLLAARNPGNHFGEFKRALEGLLLTVSDDGARDARRLALFAEFAKYTDEFLERRTVDHVRGAHALAGRHAHIARPVLHERETPGRILALARGPPE